MSRILRKYGRYGCEEAWAIHRQREIELAKLMIYHLVNSLRCGDRPSACLEKVPDGRQLVEFAAAAWTPFHTRFFEDSKVGHHHREPAWLAFTDRLSHMIARGATTPLEALTDDIYAELVAVPIQRHLDVQRRDWEEDRPFGIWSYDVHDDYVALHIYNVYMPESPFLHATEIFASLDRIIQELDQGGLKITRIGVDSWVNSLPGFKEFFPEEFVSSMVPTSPDAKTGNGWWGQFISRTGHLHEPRAQLLRQTRRFEYVRTHGECSFEALRQHVRRAMKGG